MTIQKLKLIIFFYPCSNLVIEPNHPAMESLCVCVWGRFRESFNIKTIYCYYVCFFLFFLFCFLSAGEKLSRIFKQENFYHLEYSNHCLIFMFLPMQRELIFPDWFKFLLIRKENKVKLKLVIVKFIIETSLFLSIFFFLWWVGSGWRITIIIIDFD